MFRWVDSVNEHALPLIQITGRPKMVICVMEGNLSQLLMQNL
jgi:hypothetical protein